MKLVFAGTPEFAAVSLAELIAARHEITLVLTQPDRPAGRGLKPQPSAVKRLALEHGLPVLQPPSLRDLAAQAAISAAQPQALTVVAYGLLLPSAVLSIPARGCLNVHASLLPRWRGAAPIQRALLAGDAETGVTIMRMEETLDTGPVLLRRAVPIAPDDTAGALHDRLAALGGELLVETLAMNPPARPQEEAGVTYAPKIAKAETEIDWRKPAREIGRQVRAFDPTPGAQTRHQDAVLKIWRASPAPADRAAPPGTVLDAGASGIRVACGEGAFLVTELQRAGGRRLAAREFLSGYRLERGARLGSASP
jgi:methionyl-tRNA formyltransferase